MRLRLSCCLPSLRRRDFRGLATVAHHDALFPTVADVTLFISRSRYRWDAGSADAETEHHAAIASARRTMLRHAAVEMGDKDGPQTAEIERYMERGTWREAELFDSLRPSADNLAVLAASLGVEASTIRSALSQLRHTSSNPMGAAGMWFEQEEGGPTAGQLREEIKAGTYQDLARRMPGAEPEHVRRLWSLVNEDELDECTLRSIDTASGVVAFMDVLSTAFPADFGEPGAPEWTTDQLVAELEQAESSTDGQSREELEACRQKIEAAERESWTLDDILTALGENSPTGGDATGESTERDDGGGSGEASSAIRARWSEVNGGLAGNGYGSYVLADEDHREIRRDEYAQRLQFYVDSGVRGHMLLCLDSLGISIESFRHWLQSGEIPREWGGATLNPEEAALISRTAAQNALLVTKIQRLAQALRRTPAVVEDAAQSKSWRLALSEPPFQDDHRPAAQLIQALVWAADALEFIAGSSAAGDRGVPCRQAALDRIVKATALCQIEDGTNDSADMSPAWPYADDDGIDAPAADIDAVVKAVGEVAATLGEPAACVAALCSDIQKGTSRLEKHKSNLAQAGATSAAQQREIGIQMKRVQNAAGLPLSDFAARCRADYFNKLSAGQLSTYEDSHRWFVEMRETYWLAAGQEWTSAVIRPHVWRAVVEELGNQATDEYWAGFVRAKQRDLKLQKQGRGRRRGRKSREMPWLTISQANAQQIEGDPAWEQLSQHLGDANADWLNRLPSQSKMFSKGKRGDMFAQSNHFTAPKGDEGLAQEAVHSAVTWRTKQFMWDLHSRDPVKWYRPNSPVWSSATDRCFAGTRAR